MPKLCYGARAPYLRFNSLNEFYEALGFLCNDLRHNVEFQWEYNENSGAWGNEGRIHFFACPNGELYNPMPIALENRLTRGRWNILARINCNEFIKELAQNFGFEVNPDKPGNLITRSPQGLIPPENAEEFIPNEYLDDFYRGFNM